MSAELAFAERRQFGRRTTTIRGNALVPGQAKRPFTIRNMSDGGAQLAFDEAFSPPRLFRIEIDATRFTAQCELRHDASGVAGIRFVTLADGVAINRHFQLKAVDVKPAPMAVVAVAVAACSRVKGSDLRQALGLASPSGA